MRNTNRPRDDELPAAARAVGGLCMLFAAAVGVAWVASLFVPAVAANVIVVFVVGFVLYAYGIDSGGGGVTDG